MVWPSLWSHRPNLLKSETNIIHSKYFRLQKVEKDSENHLVIWIFHKVNIGKGLPHLKWSLGKHKNHTQKKANCQDAQQSGNRAILGWKILGKHGCVFSPPQRCLVNFARTANVRTHPCFNCDRCWLSPMIKFKRLWIRICFTVIWRIQFSFFNGRSKVVRAPARP